MLHGFVVILLLCRLLWTFVEVSMAQATCVHKNPTLKLPECTNNCLNTTTGACTREGCMCGDDLKAWCEASNEGPQIWFSMYGYCVAIDCTDDGDIESLMAIFTLQCEDTVGGPLTNDSVPLPLRDYAQKNTFTFTATTTPSVSRSGSQSVTQNAISVLGSLSSATAGDSTATVLGNGASSMSSAAASSATSTSQLDEPLLSTAAIAGVAVGGIVLLGLIAFAVFFFLRRHKRKKPAKPVPSPGYEPADDKYAYIKPELDGQALEHQYSETSVCEPVEYAELDTGSPVNSGAEPVQLSANGTRAKTAPDF